MVPAADLILYSPYTLLSTRPALDPRRPARLLAPDFPDRNRPRYPIRVGDALAFRHPGPPHRKLREPVQEKVKAPPIRFAAEVGLPHEPHELKLFKP